MYNYYYVVLTLNEVNNMVSKYVDDLLKDLYEKKNMEKTKNAGKTDSNVVKTTTEESMDLYKKRISNSQLMSNIAMGGCNFENPVTEDDIDVTMGLYEGSIKRNDIERAIKTHRTAVSLITGRHPIKIIDPNYSAL